MSPYRYTRCHRKYVPLLLWRCEAALGYRCIYSLCLIPCTPAYRWQNSINPYQNGRPRRRKKDMKTVKRCHIDLTLLKTKGWVNDKFNVQRSSLKKISSSNFWNNLPVSLSFWCNFISAHYLWTVKTNFWHTFLVAFSGLDGLSGFFWSWWTERTFFSLWNANTAFLKVSSEVNVFQYL